MKVRGVALLRISSMYSLSVRQYTEYPEHCALSCAIGCLGLSIICYINLLGKLQKKLFFLNSRAIKTGGEKDRPLRKKNPTAIKLEGVLVKALMARPLKKELFLWRPLVSCILDLKFKQK